MRNDRPLIPALLISALFVCGSAISDEFSPSPVSVEEIRAEYHKVVNEKHNSFKIEFEMEEVGGTLTLHYAGGAIRAATAEYGYEHGGVGISAYYKNGAPFFVLVEESVWKFVGEGKTEDTIRETRFYVAEGKAISVLRKSYKGSSDAELKAARDKAENKAVPLAEAEFPRLLKVVQQMVAVRDADQAAAVLLAD